MKRFFLAFGGILSLSVSALAQNPDETIAVYAEKFSEERCYLHYDKSSYAPGETIWFKAYLMDGIAPADESKTFYVDITDEKGKLLAHNAYPVVDASTNGQFAIPGEYSGNYIHVKAYTKWMLNFDSAFIYNKDIRVLLRKPSGPVAKPVITPSVQFFPEGGDLILNTSNRIAFKANDQWGRPVNIKGSVVNNKGTREDSLISLHDGMGYFFLTPREGETYSAKWKDEKGNQYSDPLPVARATGISMLLTFSGPKRTITLSTAAEAAKAIDSVHMIGTMNKQLVFKTTNSIAAGSARIGIPTQDLPSGILTITVFNKQWEPLAERITFINNQDYIFQPAMEVQHWGLSKRARNEIRITIPDSMLANLSVAVTDADIETDSSNTIISHLLLTSDIKGRVYNPSYYFSGNDEKIRQHLDLVMMTHGWRRFQWDQVVKNKFPSILYARDTNYLSLSGKVYGVQPSQLRDAGEVILFMKPKSGEVKTLLLPIGPNGVFEDPSLVIFDSVHVYYQFSKKKIIGDASVQFLGNLLPPFSWNKPASGYFYNQANDTSGNSRHYALADEAAELLKYEGKVLANVTVKAKTKSPLQVMDDKYASGFFHGGDGYQFDLLNDFRTGGVANIFQYLQGKVAGLQINENGNPPSVTWRNSAVQLYVDEMRADPSMVSSIPVTDIAYIKVLRPPFMGGSGGGAGGAIAIYTRKGNDIASTPGKGLSSNLVRGYSEIRQFYSPNYSSFKPENEKKDIRTTLYWNPQVTITPQNKKAVLIFYNNDVSRAFRVIIEGMSRDGRLAHLEQVME